MKKEKNYKTGSRTLTLYDNSKSESDRITSIKKRFMLSKFVFETIPRKTVVRNIFLVK